MKNLIKTILVLLVTANFAFSQSTKTFVKTLDVKSTALSIDFPNTNTSKPTKGGLILTINIQANVSTSVVESLTKAGRYNVKVEEVNGVSVVTMPQLAKKVKFNDVEIIEKINIEINLPEGYSLVDKS